MADLKDQITVVEIVYHRPALDGDTVTVESRFSYPLETCEQVYKRKRTATQQWEPVDLGWLEDNAGTIVIQNHAGENLQRQPTEEERAALAEQAIYLTTDRHSVGACWVVSPGASMRGLCSDPRDLLICCGIESETVPYTIHVFPK